MQQKTKKSDEWYTPKYIFDAFETYFDLDVACPKDLTYVHTPAILFISENSLDKNWKGFVWMNPPFGNQGNKFKWLEKFADHKNGIALMPDRTSAPWWHFIAQKSDCILFVKSKIKFIRPDGSSGDSPGDGTTLFGIGEKAKQALTNAEKNGLGILYNKFQ